MNPLIRKTIIITLTILITLLTITGLGAMMWQFRTILAYIFVAAVLSLMGRPILKILGKIQIKGWKIPAALRAVLTLLALFMIFASIFALTIPSLLEQTQKLQSIDVNAVASGLEEPIQSIEAFVREYDLLDLESEEETIAQYFRDNIFKVLDMTRISSFAEEVIGFTGDLLIAIFAITFIAFFFLKDRSLLHDFPRLLTPKMYRKHLDRILVSVKTLLTRYFIGVATEILLVGLLISLGLGILGVEHALVIGFVAGLFNVIPYLGPIIGALIGMSLAILGSLELNFYAETLPLVLKVLVIFLIVQLIDNFIFQPLIYSSSVKAHPLEVFIVILLASSLAGVGGMILAVPVYTLLRVIAREFFNQYEAVRAITKNIENP